MTNVNEDRPSRHELHNNKPDGKAVNYAHLQHNANLLSLKIVVKRRIRVGIGLLRDMIISCPNPR